MPENQVFYLGHPKIVLLNLPARDSVTQADPWLRQFIAGSVSCHPVPGPSFSLWHLWWHRVNFFPCTLVSP